MMNEKNIYVTLLYRSELSEILDKAIETVYAYGDWYTAFPLVRKDFRYCIPEGHEDIEEDPAAFRWYDHAVAHQTMKYRELYPKVEELVRLVTIRNVISDQVALASVSEHAGTCYAVELALADRQYVKVYADFLFTNDINYERFQQFDFVRIIRRWGWCSETYYLLFAFMAVGSNYFHDAVDYLRYHDCNLREYLEDPVEVDKLLSALAGFLVSIGYDTDNEAQYGWIKAGFEELVLEHVYRPCNFVFPENVIKAERLINRYPEVRKMTVSQIMALEVDENTQSEGWSWDDDDIPEI